MSLKVLIILSLVAVATAGPTPTLFPKLPSLNLERLLNIGGSDMGSGISALFRGLIGDKRIARTSGLDAILSIKVKDFGGVCDLATRVVVSLSDTIEASIKGLGILISRVVVCLLRIIICFLGNGGNNPVCSNSINGLVGVSASGAVDIRALIKLYGLLDVKAQFDNIVRIYTRGRGLVACKYGLGVVFGLAQYWVDLLDGHITGVRLLTKADLSICFEKISIFLGVIGNTRKAGSGITILKNFIPVCNQYLVKAGFNEIGNHEAIVASCNQGNYDIYSPWAISDVDISASTGIGGILSLVFRGLNGVTRLAANLLQDFGNSVLRTVDDVFTLYIRIALGLGGVVDATIYGLGTLYVRIAAGLLKIILCFVGKGNYGICRPGWDKIVGVDGDVTSIDLVTSLYGLADCRGQVDRYIDIYTNGKGVGSLTGSIKNIASSCITLADIFAAKKWETTVVVTVITEVTTCLGSVTNSNSKGVGTAVCNKFIPACDKLLSNAGFVGFGKAAVTVGASIDLANNDEFNWCAGVDNGENKAGAGFVNTGVGVSVGGSGSGSVSSGGVIGGLFKGIFGKIKGVGHLAVSALKTIIDIKIQALSDVFSLFVNLSFVVQVTLDNLVIGLGSLLTRLVACIIKIAVCVKGYPGDKGICTTGWNQRWGLDGDSDNAAGLILLFELSQAKYEYNDYVNKCTNGKGIGSASPSVKTALEQISILIDIITNSDQITKESVTKTIVSLTIISGCIGNSQKTDSGKDLTQQVIPACSKYLTGAGYIDISLQISFIINECSKSNNDNVNWNGGYNTTPAPGGSNTTPSPGGNTTPSGGSNTTPSGGSNTTPSGGSYTTPSGGSNTTPSGGSNTTPSGGGGTTPSSGGGDTTPAPGGGTTPSSGGGGTTPSSGGGDTTPAPGGGTTPSSGGGGTTPSSGGGDTTPAPGGGTTPSSGGGGTTPSSGGGGTTPSSGGGDTTPASGGGTTPSSGGGDNTPVPDDGTCPASDGGDTTPAPGGGTTASSGGGDTTPAPGGGTTPSSGGGDTTSAPGGGTTPSSGGGDTTPAPGGGTTSSSGGGDTTPAPGGGTTPSSGGGDTTPAPGGGTTPSSGGGDTTPAPGGDTTPSSGGGDTTPAPGGGTTPSSGGGDTTPAPGGGTTPSSGGGDTTPAQGGGTTPSSGGGGTTPSTGGDTNSDNCGAVIAGGIQVIPGVTKFSINIIQELINFKIRTDVDVINLTCKLTLALGGIIDLIVTGLGSILSRIVAVYFKIGYCVYGWGSSNAICNKEWNAQFGINGEATTEKDLIALFRLNNVKSDCSTLIGSYKGQVTGVVKVIFDILTSLSGTLGAGVSKEYLGTVVISTFTIFSSVTNSYSKGSGSVIIRKVVPVCSPYLVGQGLPDISAKVNVILNASVVGDSDRIDWKALQVISSKTDQAVANVKDVFKAVKDNKNVNQVSLTAILNLEIPFNFDGVLSFAIKVVQALGGIIDVFISGLGSLFVRIVGCLVYYIVAVLGGARNANSFVSQKAYFNSFGVVVSGNTWVDLLTSFKLTNCKSDYDGILSVYTKGKGIGSLNGGVKLFFTSIDALIAIVLKAEKILEAELSAVIRIVITLLGGFANSCSANLGNKITETFVSVCSSFLVKNSYPVIELQPVTVSINDCNNIVAPWSTQITTTVVTN